MGAHPCLACGACCAQFRVAFHWSETDAAPDGRTPQALTESLDAHRVVMRGTYGGEAIRCIALRGDIGVATACHIYARRPSPCRAVRASFEDGTHDAQCDRARVAHGLEPLTRDDWRDDDAR